jgi:hypothetical protein
MIRATTLDHCLARRQPDAPVPDLGDSLAHAINRNGLFDSLTSFHLWLGSALENGQVASHATFSSAVTAEKCVASCVIPPKLVGARLPVKRKLGQLDRRTVCTAFSITIERLRLFAGRKSGGSTGKYSYTA